MSLASNILEISEEELLDKVERLRGEFENSIAMNKIPQPTVLNDVIKDGHGIRMMLHSGGVNPHEGDLGHALGHIARDKMHAWVLCHNRNIPQEVLMPTYLAAEHHDAGSFLIDRYSEDKRAVRHAEYGGLRVFDILLAHGIDRLTALKVVYGIFAHTHYLKDRSVTCLDGVKRTTRPYFDLTRENTPLLFVTMPRAVDRLDCTNPAFVVRHLISKFDVVKGRKDHADFDGKDFYSVDFTHHMSIQNRAPEVYRGSKDFPQNAIEHVQMFIDSQNAISPYAKNDDGFMRFLITSNCERTQRIVNSLLSPRRISDLEAFSISRRFTDMIAHTIEPTKQGGIGAVAIVQAIGLLDDEVRNAWINGMEAIMREYTLGSVPYVEFLEKQPKELRSLDPWHSDILEIIKPHESWAQ